MPSQLLADMDPLFFCSNLCPSNAGFFVKKKLIKIIDVIDLIFSLQIITHLLIYTIL